MKESPAGWWAGQCRCRNSALCQRVHKQSAQSWHPPHFPCMHGKSSFELVTRHAVLWGADTSPRELNSFERAILIGSQGVRVALGCKQVPILLRWGIPAVP